MNEIPQIQISQLPTPINLPAVIQYIEYMGPIIAQSKMAGCDNVAQGKVLASMQVMRGIPLDEIIKTYHFIEGKLSMRSEAMLHKFRDQYGGKHVILRRDPEVVAIRLTDRHGVTTERSLSWEEIKDEPFTQKPKSKGGGLKDNYATPHKRMQMMWARLVSDTVRAVEPGVVAGTYTPEEIGDFSPGSEVAIEGEFTTEAISPATTLAERAPPQLPQQPPVMSWNMSDPAGPDEIQAIKNLVTEIAPHDADVVTRLKAVLDGMGKKLDQLTHAEAQQMKAKLDARLAGFRFG